MDGRGRLAQSLKRLAQRARPTKTRALLRRASVAASAQYPAHYDLDPAHYELARPPSRALRLARWYWLSIVNAEVPRGVGVSATVLVILGSLVYGAVKGDHVTTLVAALEEAREETANALGFGVVSVVLTGNRHATREEILAAAGVTGRSSLLLLDVEDVRERLKRNPWIADATVLKLYPGELQIGVTERDPFALWQKDGRVAVIAEDGTVLEPYVAPDLLRLPLMVGRGAATRAKDLITLLDRYPGIRDQVRASILVGERRWNLRLTNGLDIRLPEIDVARALDRLVALDREVKLISRDIDAIDLRLPDRVTVRLSPAAAEARGEALKDKKPKKKGGAA